MPAISGIDDTDVGRNMFGNEVRGATLVMSHNKHVAMHRFEVAQHVQQCFSLAGGRSTDVDVLDVRGKAFGGKFKCGARARTRFKEEVDDGFTT